ncbi:MAG: hypothetical protein V3T31_12325 [candidate division Zixibacteria bacterium]
MRASLKTMTAIIAATTLLLAGTMTVSADKLPVSEAGQIGQPEGEIAFIRQKNVWTMNADGSEATMVAEVVNAEGRLSFSPDNRRIVFTRSGSIDLRAPDGMGGKHKVYDLFLAYRDSADVNNRLFWRRITDELGSRSAQWLPDGRLIFARDMNANMANALEPNYQICMSDEMGDDLQILRKDYLNMVEHMTFPSLSINDELAFINFYDYKQQGFAVLPISEVMTSMDSVKAISGNFKQCFVPAWSPDGKWLVYVKGDMKSPGVYISTPDLRTQYLVFDPPVGIYPGTMAPPCFSPDSKWITFSTTDKAIWIVDITGNGARRLSPPGLDQAPAWSK